MTPTTTPTAEPEPERSFAAYLSADGSPRIDTFMARARPGGLDGEELGRWAVARARGALDAIAALDGTLPGQPLGVRMARRADGWLVAAPAARNRVAFHGPWGVRTATRAALDDPGVARALGGDGRHPALIDESRGEPRAAGLDVAVAVSLAAWSVDNGRHVHRACWTAGGGPWLGVALAPELEVVSTCHLAVDGHGHGLLAARILAEADDVRPWRTRVSPGAAVIDAVHVQALGFASVVLDEPPRFTRAAYAMGRAIDAWIGGRITPTFQIPVAPGEHGDATRLAGRVVHAVMQVRRGEPFAAFEARLRRVVHRNRQGRGLLEVLGYVGVRLPGPVARRILGRAPAPQPLFPLVGLLAGRGCLSSIRLPADAPALVAASAPSLAVTAADPRGALVLTLVRSSATTASVAGTGKAGTPRGAAAFLALWQEELTRC